MDKLLCYLRMVKVPQLFIVHTLSRGHSSSMLRDGLLLSLDPHDCRVTSPHIGVLIPSGALQKELKRQQKREKINTRGIDSGKRPSGG